VKKRTSRPRAQGCECPTGRSDPRIVGLDSPLAIGSGDLAKQPEQSPAPTLLRLGGSGNPDRARMRFHLSSFHFVRWSSH
jgi:hypothetical protein